MPAVRIGALVNTRAGRARRDPVLVERLHRHVPAERLRATRSTEEIAPALDVLRKADVDTLVVVGGDGSVGGTLGVLVERWPAAAWPRVLLAPGGTVNTISRSLGATGTPETLLERLCRSPECFAESRRPLVRVTPADGASRSGMIFANGVAVRWLELYYEDSPLGVVGATQVVARIAGSALVGGGLARRVFAPVAARIELDEHPLDCDRFTVVAASSVLHIGLGFQPFHTAGSDPERFHFAITNAPARRLVRELPALRAGKPTPGSCVTHHSVRRARLRFETPQAWSIDADLHPKTRELELSATPPLRFLTSAKRP
ncbi:MAG TPA: diacylglycerol kinase family protein [Myxococcota bacterium]|nr:diacylglycerol kinase family protein [Myxococcota bacterium]HJO22645.1 diacylglycerol kinase family protein [Myxococcota bacterium]